MKWFRNIFRDGRDETRAALSVVRDKFESFMALLDCNNRVLKAIADMEEKSQEEYLFDIAYIRESLSEIRSGVGTIIDNMILLGGPDYEVLRDCYRDIDAEIAGFLPGGRPIERDEFVIPLSEVGIGRAGSVGGKNAQLGEMKRLGLPVPEGFAVSAWAYKHFIDANDLQQRISERLRAVDIRSYEQLALVSEEIRNMVAEVPVPDDLARAIRKGCESLVKRSPPGKIAMRSSALGEDTHLSFAGQYESFLNVRGDEVVSRYRDVVAGKFTPKAIYYFLSHELSESDLAMGVCCLAMVDAAASGVVYTRDPVNADQGSMVVNAILGLGKYLVDGTLTPDLFRVSRKDGQVMEARISRKTVRLVMGPDSGAVNEEVPAGEQELPSISDETLKELAEHAIKIEGHYGSPQDIEWAVDREGRLFLLQTRPLRVLKTRPSADFPEAAKLEVLLAEGVTVCPGAGAGPVFIAGSTDDLAGVPEGAVLVAAHPFPGLITVLGRVSAMVTEVGGVASHMATIAREYRVPTLAGAKGASGLPAGVEVTVDASSAVIYQGSHPGLVEARRPEYDAFDDVDIFALLKEILKRVSPLYLLHPNDPEFKAENSRTFHDITRFCHQRAMDEMFHKAASLKHKEQISLPLKTEVPIQMHIIYIDKDPASFRDLRYIKEDEIDSAPMKAFWEGLLKEGWPRRTPPADVKGFMSVMATGVTTGSREDFSESSFAILSKEYMILSLRMGYHFTTIEAMCTELPSKNFVRMQFKEGGAAIDRRMRRIKLIVDVLSMAGFESSSRGDFLDTRSSYEECGTILHKVSLLGRLTILTKQLDMALSNDAIANWYTRDIAKKLGLKAPGEAP